MNGFENNLVTLCEVMVEEYPIEDCLQSKTTDKSTTEMSTVALDVDAPIYITCKTSLMLVDKQITNARPLSVLHMKSKLRCFQRCLRMNNECWSFDYVMTSGQCRLYGVKAGDLIADDNKPGCLVYAVVRG
ncbi:uncharacterized protein [Asterias amurensis]|uniref:uncharacterized protein n=1 Tax=Asterias amurensis TaxID=7602 RepID=UPI003AB16557